MFNLILSYVDIVISILLQSVFIYFISLFFLQNMDTDENADEVFLKKTKNSVKITKNDKNSETTPKKDFEKWELVPPDGKLNQLIPKTF